MEPYIHTLSLCNSLLSSCLPQPLSSEASRLSRALNHLSEESANPDSTVIRRENASAAEEVLSIALAGADEVLVAASGLSDGASAEELRDLGERVGCHGWAFDLMMRVLQKSDAKALLRTISPLPVLQNLRRLLDTHVGGSKAVTMRFEKLAQQSGRRLSDLRVDSSIRLLIFWAFKAIRACARAKERRKVEVSGWVNLLKAVWLLLRVGEPELVETRAVVALLSTELLFTFTSLLKEGLATPGINAVSIHGDFRIFPEGFVEAVRKEKVIERRPEALEQAILETLMDVSSLTSSISPRQVEEYEQPGYSPRGSASLSETPNIPRRMSSVRRKERPPLKLDTFHAGPMMSRRRPIPNRTRLPTPPSSDVSLEELKARGEFEEDLCPLPVFDRPRAPHSFGQRELERISDDPWGDSPTLGKQEGFPTPVKISPFKKTGWAVEIRRQDTPDSIPTIRTPSITEKSEKSSPSSEKARSTRSTTPEEPEVLKKMQRLSVVQGYDSRAPSPSGSSIVINDDGHPINLEGEYGVRPGEREIMPEVFGPMKLRASETGDIGSAWENCIVRVFQNEISGCYRFLTLRGKNVDQRNIPLQAAELVPEYGYHEDYPVIYFRKAATGSYSLQSGQKKSCRTFQGEIPPASLYYKFFNLIDMFSFQQAFLGESVEADVRNIKTIRYTRGFRDGEHSNHKARLQLWKEQVPTSEIRRRSSVLNRGRAGSVGLAPTYRGTSEALRVRPTRMVMYLDEIIMTIFVTDDVTVSIPGSSPRTMKIRPSAHKAFNNPSSVKATIMGNRDISGGFRLDKDGMGIEMHEAGGQYDEVKWFEIDFASEAECRCFHDDFVAALQQRRRERRMVEELKRKASLGVRANHASSEIERGIMNVRYV